MRPTPARVLLSLVGVGAVVAGVLTRQLAFLMVALGAAILLGTSLRTSRLPLTRALQGFQGRIVEVRLWGAAPSDVSGATLILTEVNSLGAGTHVFFDVRGGRAMHLKIAQAQGARLAEDAVTVESARYVQWNGRKLRPVGDAPAVTISVSEGPAPRERSTT